MDDGVIVAGNRTALQFHSHETLGRSLFSGLLKGFPADESGWHFQMHQPPQARLKGGGGSVHVLAVEMHGCFQTQSVASAEAAGRHTLLEQLLPKLPAVVCVEQQLHAILSGVASACCEHWSLESLNVETAVAEARQFAEVAATQSLHKADCLWPLESEQHAILLFVKDLQISSLKMLANPGGISFCASCIDHNQQGFVSRVQQRWPEVIND